MRIEVGYGLEPMLTDAKSKMILEDILIPELRAGQTDRAINLAVIPLGSLCLFLQFVRRAWLSVHGVGPPPRRAGSAG